MYMMDSNADDIFTVTLEVLVTCKNAPFYLSPAKVLPAIACRGSEFPEVNNRGICIHACACVYLAFCFKYTVFQFHFSSLPFVLGDMMNSQVCPISYSFP